MNVKKIFEKRRVVRMDDIQFVVSTVPSSLPLEVNPEIFKKKKRLPFTSAVTKIKISFLILTSALLTTVMGGSYFVKDNPYFSQNYLTSRVSALEYRVAYGKSENLGTLAALSGIFGNSSSITPVVFEAGQNKNAGSIPVLVYHGILDKSDGSDENLLVGDFKNQMLALKRDGWNTITTSDLYKFLKGQKNLPDKSFLLTFDDGRKDSYYRADPIIQTIGYNAVMFTISRFSLDSPTKNNYYLDKEELRQMIDSGRWEIQAHAKNGHAEFPISPDGTLAPFYANKLWLPDQNRNETDAEFKSRITTDLAGVKSDIESNLGVSVKSFAFPFGDFGQNHSNYDESQIVAIDSAKNLYGLLYFQNAPGVRFTGNYWGEKPVAGTSSFLVKRIHMTNNMTPASLLKTMNFGNPKSIPYRDSFESDNGWINAWGTQNIESHSMTIMAKDGETGSASVLDGTYGWKDYVMKADVNLPKANGIYMWARFQNDNNNAACNIGRDFVHIEETVNGKGRVIKGGSEKVNLPKGFFNAAVAVKGRNIGCYVDGKLVIESSFLDPSLDKGGVGFKAWDNIPNNSEIIVKELSVDPL